MPGIVIVGAQWGDEGKGKVIDVLAERAAVVARYQGGSNAGHTVLVGDEEFKFRLLPSGVPSLSMSYHSSSNLTYPPLPLIELSIATLQVSAITGKVVRVEHETKAQEEAEKRQDEKKGKH